MTKELHLPEETFLYLLKHSEHLSLKSKNATQGTKVIAAIEKLSKNIMKEDFEIALICPNSFDDFHAIEEELKKYNYLSKITCATSNAYNLAKLYADKYSISLYKEERGNKNFNLRKIVQCVNEVLMFEYTDRDTSAYSLTQNAHTEAKRINKKVNLVEKEKELFKIRKIT